MKRKYFASILIATCMIFAFSNCKSLRKAQGDTEKGEVAALLLKTEKEILNYETLNLSGKARIEIPEMEINGLSANYRIQMMKNDRILIRISKVIEVFRILATRDSVYILDKINHNIISCDYKLLEKMIGIEANFSLLHDMITGNFHPIPDKLRPSSTTESTKKFTGRKASTDFAYFINPKIRKVVKITAQDTSSGYKTELNYEHFEAYGETMMPMAGSARVLAPQVFNFDFEHNKININPENLSFAFNIPDNYARMGCK